MPFADLPFKHVEARMVWEAWFSRNCGRDPDEVKMAFAIAHLMQDELADIATLHGVDIIDKAIKVARLTELASRSEHVRQWRRQLHPTITAAVYSETASLIHESLRREPPR